MPTGFLQWKETDSTDNLSDSEGCRAKRDIKQLLNTTFGFYEVDIKVPENLHNELSEFPPIFKNVLINGKERKLISCLSAKKILLYHSLLEWYIDHGLVVDKIYGYIECKRCQTFNKFGELVCNERRKGDAEPELKIIGEEMKNIGNSAFGRTAMNKSKHTKISFKDIVHYKRCVNKPYFKDATQMNDFFEVEMKKK